jgi:hypothetical protein
MKRLFRHFSQSPYRLLCLGPNIFLTAVLIWLQRETHYSPSSSAKFKNVWGFTSTLPYIIVIVRWCLSTRAALTYEGVSKSFRTSRLERELQMV